MSSDSVNILKINVTTLSETNILEYVEKGLNKRLGARGEGLEKEKFPLTIFSANPEIIVYGQKDEKFREIVNSAQINIPDGWGVVWASKILGKPIPTRIAGVDLLQKLCGLAGKQHATIGLIGGKSGVALRALECLQKKYPGLEGWAEENIKVEVKSQKLKVISGDINQLINKIKEKNTKIIFVAFGVPKQEYFIDLITNSNLLSTSTPVVFLSVGGSFDYLSGQVPRAPLIIRSIGFEWVWRLVKEPWRWKRQLALLKFIKLVLLEKLASKEVVLRG